MKAKFTEKNFNYLWSSTTISLLGTEVTKFTIPTIAILLLNANPFEVGILKASESIAFPLLGLFAGVLADRSNPKKIMIITDLLQALVILFVPVVFMMDMLTIKFLIVVALIMGILHVFSNVSFLALIPKTVEERKLTASNSKLNMSQSFAQVVGPAISGFIVKVLGNVLTLIVDGVSFLLSALLLLFIKVKPIEVKKENRSVKSDILNGLKFVLSNSNLRFLLLVTAIGNLGFSIIQPLFLVKAYRYHNLTPDQMGLVLAIGSSGLLLGALLNSKIVKIIGVGKTLFSSLVLIGISGLIISQVDGYYIKYYLTLLWFLISFAIPLYNINQFTFRQLITPPDMQGRMNATMRIAIMGVFPIGSLIGGSIAEFISIYFAIILGGGMYLLSAVILSFSPLFKLKYQPDPIKVTN